MSKKRSSKRAVAKQQNNRWLWIALAAAAVVIIAVVVIAQLSNQTAPTAQAANGASSSAALAAEISVAEAAQKRSEGAFILDVREPSEWVEAHIPGATLIPLGELAARVSEVPRDQEIVVVCRSGNRSQQGRDILRQAGLTTVTSMAGGLNEWRAQGLPTESGS